MPRFSFKATSATGAGAWSGRLRAHVRPGLEWWVPTLLLALPWLSLVFKIGALAIHKVDLPMLDDWREFMDEIGSLDPAYLFAPHQDTMVPVGTALDSLFARYLNGNVVVYEVLSLTVVLGSLLFVQQRLLRSVIHERWIYASAFFSTVLMLQPGSYWGRQFLAYHQALPILCLLVAIYLAVAGERRRDFGLMALLALLAGFSYISGAFSGVAVAAVLLVHAVLFRGQARRRMLLSGLSVGVPAAVASAAQAWVILRVQGGQTHRADSPWALPTDSDFWFYMLGKFGRAFGLPPAMPMGSLLATLLVLAVGLAAAAWVLVPVWSRLARGRQASPPDEMACKPEGLSVALLALAAAVGVYLVLVAAGRANLRPEKVDTFLEVFVWGFGRFHFFWITLLTPWLLAVALVAIRNWTPRSLPHGLSPVIAAALVATVALGTGVFGHNAYYERLGVQQSAGLNCIAEHIRASKPNISCPQIHPGNLMPAYLNASAAGLSFTRYTPPPATLDFLPGGEAVLFRLSGRSDEIRAVRAKLDRQRDGGWIMNARADPQLYVRLAPGARTCRLLQVTVEQTAKVPGFLQVFYRGVGERGFARERSATASFPAGRQRRSVFLQSSDGFAQGLRIDPVASPQTVQLHSLRAGCLKRL